MRASAVIAPHFPRVYGRTMLRSALLVLGVGGLLAGCSGGGDDSGSTGSGGSAGSGGSSGVGGSMGGASGGGSSGSSGSGGGAGAGGGVGGTGGSSSGGSSGSGGAGGTGGSAQGGTGGGGTGGAGSSGLPPLFESAWSTALGNSANAVSDGGKWNIVGGQGGEVVASTGLGFPTANVLRVPWSGGWVLPRKTGLPIPAVGESRYYRWYMRLTIPDGVSDSQTHPVQDGNAGSQINWAFAIRHNDAGPGAFVVQYQLHTNNGWPNYQWSGPTLQKNVTYRYELHLYRNAAGTFQIHPRIYDAAGTLLADDDDYHAADNTATLASSPSFSFNDVNNLDGLNSGCNDGSQPETGTYGYESGFCVRSDAWCGPY